MRRSICVVDPKHAYVGQTAVWRFTYTSAHPIPKGAKLKFDLLSKGRPFDWQVPNANGEIWLEAGVRKILPKPIEVPGQGTLQYEFILPDELQAEETLTLVVGEGKKGNRSQCHVQRKRPFHLFIDPKGKGDYTAQPETFYIDVRGGPLDHIRLITPSLVAKNQRFDIIARFEDVFGNLTNHAPPGTLIELSYEQLRDNLSWKLFVPETGFIALPNLYFNEKGVYRFRLLNTQNGKTYFSEPILCVDELENKNLFWGTFHGESERYDAKSSIESLLRHIRDDSALQFFSTSTFDDESAMSNDDWKKVALHVSEFNEEERFVVFLGQQWFGEEPSEGLRQFVYLRDNKPLLRQKESKTARLKKIYKSHTTKDFISIPCFTMGKGLDCNFDDFQPDYEPVVEIYNAWGSSECSAKEGNPKPIYAKSQKGIQESLTGSIRRALNRGLRFGFVAGGLDDRGVYSGCFETNQAQYTPGLTAILSDNHSRDGLLLALRNRSSYATTGERIIANLSLASRPIGSILSTKEKPGLAFVRYIAGYAIGTTSLTAIELIRNGTIFHTFTFPKGDFKCFFTLDDTDPIEKIALHPEKEGPSFIYYYLRITQQDGHIAWTSPIWVDWIDDDHSKRPKKKS